LEYSSIEERLKMNKSILILFLAAVMLTVSVSAWHCTDTDKPTLTKGTWGDNGLLNGTTRGWAATSTAPLGCTGTQGNFSCVDKCDGTSLIEYYCGDRPSTTSTYQDCNKVAYKDCKNVTKNVCEWKKVNGHWKNVCNKVTNKVCTTKYKQVCTTKTKTTSHLGETIIYRKEYKNSNQCIPETPEFGVVAGGIALVGALGIFLYRRH